MEKAVYTVYVVACSLLKWCKVSITTVCIQHSKKKRQKSLIKMPHCTARLVKNSLTQNRWIEQTTLVYWSESEIDPLIMGKILGYEKRGLSTQHNAVWFQNQKNPLSWRQNFFLLKRQQAKPGLPLLGITSFSSFGKIFVQFSLDHVDHFLCRKTFFNPKYERVQSLHSFYLWTLRMPYFSAIYEIPWCERIFSLRALSLSLSKASKNLGLWVLLHHFFLLILTSKLLK